MSNYPHIDPDELANDAGLNDVLGLDLLGLQVVNRALNCNHSELSLDELMLLFDVLKHLPLDLSADLITEMMRRLINHLKNEKWESNSQ